MSEKVDNVKPGEKWVFDETVTDCFEDMLERSIPQYEVMRTATANILFALLKKYSSINILDIGCSNGLNIATIKNKFDNTEKHVKYLGVDVSEPMLHKAKCTFVDDCIAGNVEFKYCDICTEFPKSSYNAITSILTVQFTPIEYRQSILQNVYDSLQSGGVFIMVEKVLGDTNTLNELFVNEYYDMKREHGYSEEQIERKRLSLQGVLVPVTNDMNIQLLQKAGFKQVDVFWRWMNFVGYIAIK